MKIVFFSEIGSSGGALYLPKYPNMRTDVAWAVALRAPVYSFNADSTTGRFGEGFDLGIIIVPKKDPKRAFEFFEQNRHGCRTWAVMQEGPNWFWQDWPVEDQIRYGQLMSTVDRLYVHNASDIPYYKGMFDQQDVRVLPSLMIEDAIPKDRLTAPEQRQGVMIGGNFVSWYGGFDSFRVATEFQTDIFAPSMGRKQEYEDYIEDVTYLPYLPWSEWVVELSKRKYAVHMMRTHAAGTFALNAAYLGIPCIGYRGLDTQMLCHPELSVDVGDILGARRAAKHLLNNELFYKHCSAYARKAYKDNFDESVFLKNFYGQDNG
jgi:hypothetical protein